jgi:chloride channel protein, CIC family
MGIIASYTARFWALVVVIGAISGISAGLLILLLRLVERLAYGHRSATLLGAVEQAPGWRRIVVLMAAAVIVAVGARLLRDKEASSVTEVSDAIWLHSGKLDLPRSLARGVLSIVTVGMGVSLGREAAPQLFGAATASTLAQWAKLPTWQRRLLVASGAGAGFAAVYNVPLGGSLLALEVMLGTLALPMVLPALLTAVVATAMSWLLIGNHATYRVASYGFHPAVIVFAVVMGPIIGLVATGWTRLITTANHRRPQGRWRYLAPFGAFAILGLLSLQYPQLLGNGRSIVQLGIVANLSLGLLVVLLVLKPLVTALCVGSGSPGGLFTPTFAIGVLLSGVAGTLFHDIWHSAPAGAFTLIGGGAFLAAAMQGPLAGAVLVLELTRHFDQLMVPTLLAVVEATIVSRRLGAASIYSARLPSGELMQAIANANLAATAALYALDESLPRNLPLNPSGPPQVPPGRHSIPPDRDD